MHGEVAEQYDQQPESQKVMQLNKIKIVGFKSFVDPTVIDLPSNLIAVVGPNGCGKSNIIDAVTWVMGESSPKYLRGESSTDVIFNGSTGRKPVGQASVELVFDNQNGAIGGEYAQYAEISIKRQINRSAESSYFVNGLKVRKRDVLDIFRGTGLGPRSYALVGQMTISSLIESKPNDMRVYFEEAAGISQYKARRHETELRINHTRENLDRINDLRTELDKQLSHLKHQANAAEKYKVLKQEERTVRSELYAAEYRQLNTQMSESHLTIQQGETALEANQAELSRLERDTEVMHDEQREAQEAVQEVQTKYYTVGNEITRVEQEIVHHQQRAEQWQHDLAQVSRDHQELEQQLAESKERLTAFEQEIEEIEPELESASEIADEQRSALEAADEAMQEWQFSWEEFNQESAKTAQTAQVEKTRIEHLEKQIDSLQKRREELTEEQSGYNFSALEQSVEEFTQKTDEVSELVEEQSAQLDTVKQELTQEVESQREANRRLDDVRSELQGLVGQKASLEALQQTALGQRNGAATSWLEQNALTNNTRLAQHINVEAGWELAVEKILGLDLQAICAENRDGLIANLQDLPAGNISLFNPDAASAQHLADTKAETLLSKISAPWSLSSLLGGIYVAEDLSAANALCQSLEANESVVTRDGVWVNKHWIKVLREEDPAQGVIRREQELKDLSDRIEVLKSDREELEELIEERRTRIQDLEQQRDQCQAALNDRQAQAAQFKAEHKVKVERLESLKKSAERCEVALKESEQQLGIAQEELTDSREKWNAAMQILEVEADRRHELAERKEILRDQLQRAREVMDAHKDQLHSFKIRMETAKSQKESLAQNIQRMQSQQTSLLDRKAHLEGELESMPAIQALKETLEELLERHADAEADLSQEREKLSMLESQYRQYEQKRHSIDKQMNESRSQLEKLRLNYQGYKVKSDAILEQVKEAELDLEATLQSLPEHVDLKQWHENLEQIQRRIARLGAINLVAIEEYATCLERKEYLDHQMGDLEDGLTTLENAIAKIDRETRQKFKETFDQVNARFQELFPTIFGGGKAYLELTSDDLLEAGVSVMACPPGKRNSTIYLLSGGEKSLTALALIFSIFYLNPAPFCLLDEVDAALDDANVMRYTRLVKSMSDRTQFIFISHNKISIEMGEQLIGVTMNEPGVSRLVSVDINKAMDLVES